MAYVGDVVTVTATPGVIYLLREFGNAVLVQGAVETDLIAEIVLAVSPAEIELDSLVVHGGDILE